MEQGAVIKHNLDKAPKTGSWSFMRPEVEKEKCVGCSTCVPFCPEAVITVNSEQESENSKKGRKIAQVDYEYCKGCGVCAAVCPKKAIIMRKK